MTSEQLLMLLFLLFIKHYFIDFLLQPDWMIVQKSKKFSILLLHGCLHGLGTFLILVGFAGLLTAVSVSIIEIGIHTFLDFIKSNPKLLGRYKLPSIAFFNFLGLDQLLHYLTYLGIAYIFAI
jgi:hypothetical protein